jgi:hypothetical protein
MAEGSRPTALADDLIEEHSSALRKLESEKTSGRSESVVIVTRFVPVGSENECPMRTPGQMNWPPVNSQSALPGPTRRSATSVVTGAPRFVKSLHRVGGCSKGDHERVGSSSIAWARPSSCLSVLVSARTSALEPRPFLGTRTPGLRLCSSTLTDRWSTDSMQRAWKPGHGTFKSITSACDRTQACSIRMYVRKKSPSHLPFS